MTSVKEGIYGAGGIGRQNKKVIWKVLGHKFGVKDNFWESVIKSFVGG